MVEYTSEERSDIFSHFARSMIVRYAAKLEEKSRPPVLPKPRINEDLVGILGAGVGGLYTALMLESLGVPFEIVEATGRVGGRLFTHKFEGHGDYDYFVSEILLTSRYEADILL